MIIKARSISKPSYLITIFNEVRTIICVAGSRFIKFVILIYVNVRNVVV